MRGKLSDQDLTDYALNELQPEERLYLESILAVSEECRNDIYEMIEMGQLLDEGFEVEGERSSSCMLTDQQRDNLVHFRRPTPLWHRIAASLALAAGAAFAATHPNMWQVDDPAAKIAEVSTQMSRIVAAAIAPKNINFAVPLANLAALAENPGSWLPAAVDVLDPVVCTPPSWLESAQSSLGELSQ